MGRQWGLRATDGPLVEDDTFELAPETAQASVPVSANDNTPSARPSGALVRWWRRRRAQKSRIEYTAWDLRERYGAAAFGIAQASARAPGGFSRRRFWRKVAGRLRRLG